MPMRSRTSRTVSSLAVVLLAGVAACSADAPTATPTPADVATVPAPHALLGLDPLLTTTTTIIGSTTTTVNGALVSVVGLLTCPLQSQLKSTAYIGPLGGSIAVGYHKLVIPAGALTQTVQITATQVSGTAIDVDFQPHGLKFSSPATLRLSYGGCTVPPDGLQSVVYLNDSNQIIELRPSTDDSTKDVVIAPINHFSGYAVATGNASE